MIPPRPGGVCIASVHFAVALTGIGDYLLAGMGRRVSRPWTEFPQGFRALTDDPGATVHKHPSDRGEPPPLCLRSAAVSFFRIHPTAHVTAAEAKNGDRVFPVEERIAMVAPAPAHASKRRVLEVAAGLAVVVLVFAYFLPKIANYG